jgi:hypothetical protein
MSDDVDRRIERAALLTIGIITLILATVALRRGVPLAAMYFAVSATGCGLLLALL